jgi:hypothetical protein
MKVMHSVSGLPQIPAVYAMYGGKGRMPVYPNMRLALLRGR